MQIGRSEWLEGVHPPHKLDGLQFAAELHLQLIADHYPIGTGHRQRLQRGAGHGVQVRRIQPESRNRHRRFENAIETVGVGGSQHRRRNALAVGSIADIAVEPQACRSITANAPRQNRHSYPKDCRNPARAIRPGRSKCLSSRGRRRLAALRDHGRAIFKHAQDGPVCDRAQRPLPVVIVHRTPQRNQLDGLEQRGQRDIHHQLRACAHADFLAQRRQERRRAYFDAVGSGKQTRDGVEATIVGENLERLSAWAAEPRISTAAPICGAPLPSRTYPDIAPEIAPEAVPDQAGRATLMTTMARRL